jgi:hypothetical protein
MLAAMLLAQTVSAQAADRIQLENLRADVEIIPENRPDISVDVDMNGSSDATPRITYSGNTVTVAGDLQTARKVFRVSFNLDRRMDVARFKQLSRVHRDHPSGLPRLVIHTPMKVSVKSSAYVFGRIGPSQSVTIQDSGDGEWRIDTVSQEASVKGEGGTDFYLADAGSAGIDLLGTGNVTLGDMQSLWSSQWGSGDVTVDKVERDADIELSGIGDFKARNVSGKMRVLIDDAGSVTVRDGDVSTLRVRTLDGIGAVRFGGTVKDADINIGTSTKVTIHKLTGSLKQTTRQAASVEVETK